MKWLPGKQATVFLAKLSRFTELRIVRSCLWLFFVGFVLGCWLFGFFKALKDNEKYVNIIIQKCLIFRE